MVSILDYNNALTDYNKTGNKKVVTDVLKKFQAVPGNKALQGDLFPTEEELFKQAGVPTTVGGGYSGGSFSSGSSANIPYTNPLEAVNKAITDAINKQWETFNQKTKEFDAANPFAYDEVLANERTKAKTQLDPYYTQTLDDFLKGINLQRARSTEDNKNVLDELGVNQEVFNAKTQQNADLSVESNNNSAAQNGLYGSGKQLRGQGLIKTGAAQDMTVNAAETDKKRAQAALALKRSTEDTALSESTTRRNLNQEESYNVENTALGNTQQNQAQREFQKQQYVGAQPGQNPLIYDTSTYKLLGA